MPEMVSYKAWAAVALTLLTLASVAQGQAQESYLLTDNPAPVGPSGAFLMDDAGTNGPNSISIPTLDPLGLGTDTFLWVAQPYSVVDREGIGSATVTLDGNIDVAAAADIQISLNAFNSDLQLIQLGATTYSFGVQELLPDTIEVNVDIGGAVIPANALVVLQVSVQGTSVASISTDALDALFSGPESGVSGITTQILDSDMDGVPNTIEVILGSNPFNPDTDGDGTDDNEEILNGSDPTDPNNHPGQGANDHYPDTDGDGLPDVVEASLGTNPSMADSDGDSWGDGSEVFYGSNPLDGNSTPVDRDGDGIPDMVDAAPTNPDVNNNGILDGDEDSNGDGVTDSEAYKDTPIGTLDGAGVKQSLRNLGSTGSSEIFTALGLAAIGMALAAIGLARF